MKPLKGGGEKGEAVYVQKWTLLVQPLGAFGAVIDDSDIKNK